MSSFVIVLTTFPAEGNADVLARMLVEERLAACVNILGPIRSIYRWQGKVVDDSEWLLVVKSERSRFAELEARVQALHSYEVPEIVAFEIAAGSAPYLDWLLGETTPAP